MASDIDIINIGLVEIGESTIVSLLGTNKRQTTAKALYDHTRRGLLTEINWRFATHTQVLAQKVGTPVNTRYTKAYALPTDPAMIQVQYLEPNETEYAIEGASLLSNAFDLTMTYTADVEESLMPDYFVWLLGLKMAAVMAMPLTKSETRKASADKDYKEYRPVAKRADAAQQPNKPNQDAPFIDCRY